MNIKRILGRLRLDKVAAVDLPCQEGAIVALIKRVPDDEGTNGHKLAKSLYQVFEKSSVPLDPDGDEGAQAFDEVLGEQELTEEFWNAWYKGTSALQESLCSIIKDDTVTEKSSQITESLKQFADYIEAILPGDVGKAIATGIVASAGQAGTPLTKGDVMSVELKKALGLPETATDAEIMKAIADKDVAIAKGAEELEKANAELEVEKAKVTAAPDGDADDEVKKALASGDAFRTPEGAVITKKMVGEGTFQVLKSQNDRLTKSEAELEKARDADEERSFAKRAEEIGCSGEFGSVLRKAYRGDKDAQAELEKQIQGLNKQVDEGSLFKSFGSNADEGSATAEFLAKVEEVKKVNPDLTPQQAYAKAYDNRENRDIVKRMKAEQTAA